MAIFRKAARFLTGQITLTFSRYHILIGGVLLSYALYLYLYLYSQMCRPLPNLAYLDEGRETSDRFAMSLVNARAGLGTPLDKVLGASGGMAVLVYGLHRPAIGRMLHTDWWPSQDGYHTFPYNITEDWEGPQGAWIEPYDGSRFRRSRVPADVRKPHHGRQRQQASDIRAILHHWSSTKCAGYTYFLVVEDDTRPCASSASLMQWLNLWLKANDRQWGMVRVGVGLTGVIMRCDHIPLFLQQPWGPTESRAVDWAIGKFYRDYTEAVGRELVFRYTLVDHVSGISTLWDAARVAERDANEVPQCFSPIWWEGGSEHSNFDRINCEAFAFSPCDHASLRVLRSNVPAVHGRDERAPEVEEV